MATRIVAPGGVERAHQDAQGVTRSAPVNTRDLAIRYCPGRWIRFSGTSAQLEAEGLIPNGLKWPHRTNIAEWAGGGYVFKLRRARLPGSGYAPWAEGDYWALSLWIVGMRRSFLEQAIIDKEKSLCAAGRIANSEQGRRESRALIAAMQRATADMAFQAFKVRAFGLVSPKGDCASGRRGGV